MYNEILKPFKPNSFMDKLYPKKFHSPHHGNAFKSFAAEFSPIDVANLVLWLDASDAATITESSGLVSQWDDKSVAGNDMTASGTARPLTNNATQNGLNIIEFDGTTDKMDSVTASYSQPNTVYMVTTVPTSDQKPIFASTGALQNAIDRRTTSNYRLLAGVSLQGGSITTAMQILRAIFDGSSSELERNGSSILSGNAGTDNVQHFRVGANSAASAFGDVDIAEVLVYNSNPTSGEHTSILAYLNDKWAVF